MTDANPLPEQTDEVSKRWRWGIYWILIAISLGQMSGRLLAVNDVSSSQLEVYLHRAGRTNLVLQRPFLSANDRSRWITIRALVEEGTYKIDNIIQQSGWDTIDMVKHDGHLYSSKPPLYPTMLASIYWVIVNTTGATLETHPYEVGRAMLFLVNLVPMLLMFLCLAYVVEHWGRSDWGRIFVMACATLGTFLNTFAIVLNNHLPAAVCATFAIVAALKIFYDGERKLWLFFTAGFFAAFVVANELPGLAFFGLLGLLLLIKAPIQTLIAGVPGALLVIAAFFATNYIAHESWRPPYAHRNEGDDWYSYTYEKNGRTHESYWDNRVGIDRGEESPAMYAFHVILGHHGIFSLTPVWVLSFLGMFIFPFLKQTPLRGMLLFILSISLICLLFYLTRDLEDRNYGGMTSCFRWMLWFAPLWVLAMIPAADFCSKRKVLQSIAITMLFFSTLSASYPIWNPWSHPWIYEGMLHYDMIKPPGTNEE
ncbi:Hypothetical protein PBC10988_37980 [Planctomycetales bacterium 10988]|nr:Hypothetical protein PBC10988_37980 [Planctomycetales bacterium 10988]